MLDTNSATKSSQNQVHHRAYGSNQREGLQETSVVLLIALLAWILILSGTYSLLAVLTVSQPPSVLLLTSLFFVVRHGSGAAWKR